MTEHEQLIALKEYVQVLRAWSWLSAHDPRATLYKAHPLYPPNQQDIDGFGKIRPLWEAIEHVLDMTPNEVWNMPSNVLPLKR